MKKLFLILTILLAFIACKPKQVVTIPVLKDSVRIVERLVPVQLPADSSSLFALFECDSTNKVILKALNEEKSKHVNSNLIFTPGKVAQLDYKSKTTPDTVYIKGSETVKYKDILVPYPVEKITNKIHGWQTVLMWSGAAFWLLIGIAIYKQFK